MHGHIYVGILKEKAGAQDPEKPAPQTLREPAQSKCMWMHVDISQKHFFARIYGKNASVQRAYPDLTLVFHSYRKNASVWTRCLGKKLKVEKQRVLKCMHCRRLALTWARILQQIYGQEICEGRNAHGHLTRATHGNSMRKLTLQQRCRATARRQPLCASLRSRNAQSDLTRAIL